LKLYELFEDRVEQGPIDNAAFASMLAKIAAEFEAAKPKRRRGGRRRGRPVDQVEPAAAAFDIVEELH
jgi:hypothetical protein